VFTGPLELEFAQRRRCNDANDAAHAVLDQKSLNALGGFEPFGGARLVCRQIGDRVEAGFEFLGGANAELGGASASASEKSR
jgi:hypothetical protein